MTSRKKKKKNSIILNSRLSSINSVDTVIFWSEEQLV